MKNLGRSGFELGMEGDQQFALGWIQLEMSIRYSGGNVEFQVGHSHWNSRESFRLVI